MRAQCKYCGKPATEEIGDDEIATFILTCSDGDCIEKAENRLQEIKEARAS